MLVSPPPARRGVARLVWEARGTHAQLPRRQADACRHPPDDAAAAAAAVAPPVARRRRRHRRHSLGCLGTTTAIGVARSALPILVLVPALTLTLTPVLVPILVRAPVLVLVLGAGLGERLELPAVELQAAAERLRLGTELGYHRRLRVGRRKRYEECKH